MDWCRGRIFIEDLPLFPRVWWELKKHPDVAFIYNARNRFINPPPPGVRDWSIEFAVYVSDDKVAHICELQVKYVPIHLAVETGGLTVSEKHIFQLFGVMTCLAREMAQEEEEERDYRRYWTCLLCGYDDNPSAQKKCGPH